MLILNKEVGHDIIKILIYRGKVMSKKLTDEFKIEKIEDLFSDGGNISSINEEDNENKTMREINTGMPHILSSE